MASDRALGDILFEPMTSLDLEEILAIEQTGFMAPWTRDLFLQEFLTPVSRALVARIDDIKGGHLLAGYTIFWVIADGVDVLKIAVKPEYRRCGLATRLLRAVLSAAQKEGCLTATLEVRQSNTAAIRLYEKLGFLVKGIRRGYYAESGEDALTMGKDL